MKLLLALALFSSIIFAEGNGCSTLEQCQKAIAANPKSSLAHYRMGLMLFMNKEWYRASLEFQNAQRGDLDPQWVEVWSHLYAGKTFDLTNQRARAVYEYNFVMRMNAVLHDAKVLGEAKKEAAEYIKSPYRRP